MNQATAIEHFHFSTFSCPDTTQFADRRSCHQRSDGACDGVFSFGITLADATPWLNPSSGPDREVAVLPVFACSPITDSWRSAKFSHGDDECFFHQSTVIKVIEQRAESAVKDRAMAVL